MSVAEQQNPIKMSTMKLAIAFVTFVGSTEAFMVNRGGASFAMYDRDATTASKPWTPGAAAATSLLRLEATSVGTVFGSSSGSTEDVAFLVVEALNAEASGAVAAGEPVNIDDVAGSLEAFFDSVDCLVVGTPTYNTDADKQRSATSWDGVYYGELEELGKAGKLKGKHVAVFGLGDQEGYADNFADGCGELHDVFEAAGCRMFGYTSATEGYEHEASKSQRGDKFVGLVCDNANQDDLTDGRVKAWTQQLIAEGFLSAAASPAAAAPAVPAAPAAPPPASSPAPVEVAAPGGGRSLGAKTWHPNTVGGAADAKDFAPYHSKTIGATLWVSTKDHRRSYYTFDKK